MPISRSHHHFAAAIPFFLLLLLALSSLSSARQLRPDPALPGAGGEISDKDSAGYVPPQREMTPQGLRKLSYRPLILNILPKGTTTPSGPSRGSNDFRN